MKFYSESNMLVRVNRKGKLRNTKSFRFDENGEFETDNPHLINVLKRRFSFEEIEKKNEITDEEIRQLAKEKGIKSWHVKSIDKLKEELSL